MTTWTVDRTRTDAEVKAMGKSKAAAPPDGAQLARAGDRIVDATTLNPVATVVRYEDRWPLMAAAARTIEWSTLLRANGSRNRARTFGYTYRSVVLRREGCRGCSIRAAQPGVTRQLERMSAHLWELFQDAEPHQAAETARLAAGIGPEWRMGGSPWSSGVANASSELHYHQDGANIPGAWSAMLMVRDPASTGGHLHLPAYDVWLACDDRDVILFDGRANLHGVTPLGGTGQRISLVNYAISQMQACGTPEEELARARDQRTRREEQWATTRPEETEAP